MKIFYLFLVGLLFIFQSKAQQLLPSIGLAEVPELEAEICDIPLYLGNFSQSGYNVGEHVPDFKLFDTDGNEFHLATKLMAGKPVLLISSSITCPVFRNKIPKINQVASLFENQIEIAIIYTVEAHPEIDISPYFGTVNTGQQNYSSNTLFRQPTTYGERLALIDTLNNRYQINVPTFSDGPCQEWHLNYGPAPNNAYLITTAGLVAIKHAWFDRFPDNIICELEAYFDQPISCNGNNTGNFSFQLLGDTIEIGTPGETLYLNAELRNQGSNDVIIQIDRLIEEVPSGWSTSLCVDACFPPEVSSTTVQLAPGQSQLYTHYFFTDETAAEGRAGVRFRNVNNSNNKFNQMFYGKTENITTQVDGLTLNMLKVYPNPFINSLTLVFDNVMHGSFDIYDAYGNIKMKGINTSTYLELNTAEWKPSIYFIRLAGERPIKIIKTISD